MHIKIPDKGDPSDVNQFFPRYNLQVLCCRYWWLEKWEFNELSFPYWRIYHNQNSGAVILHRNREIVLDPDKVILIAPNTSYATRIRNHEIPAEGYSLIGNRITSERSKESLIAKQQILHLFIHFNLGIPFDNVSPGIYSFEVTAQLLEKIGMIRTYLLYEHQNFSFRVGLTIQSLISDLLTNLPESSWKMQAKDNRIQDVLNFIEDNLSADLSNSILAERIKIATNSFTRLFTNEIKLSPQQYVRKKRIDQACILLHHSGYTIDEIASQTGFYDRFHFTKMFIKWTGTSPAKYRKDYSMKV